MCAQRRASFRTREFNKKKVTFLFSLFKRTAPNLKCLLNVVIIFFFMRIRRHLSIYIYVPIFLGRPVQQVTYFVENNKYTQKYVLRIGRLIILFILYVYSTRTA